MKFYQPEKHQPNQMSAGMTNHLIHSGSMTFAVWRMAKDSVLAQHRHEQEQITYLVSGAIRFNAGGQEQIVRAGEALVFAPNEEHGGLVLEDGTMMVDAFNPPRNDFIEKLKAVPES